MLFGYNSTGGHGDKMDLQLDSSNNQRKKCKTVGHISTYIQEVPFLRRFRISCVKIKVRPSISNKKTTTNFTTLFLHALELTTRALNKHHKTDPKFVFFHFMPPKDNNCCVTEESWDASCSPVFLPKL